MFKKKREKKVKQPLSVEAELVQDGMELVTLPPTVAWETLHCVSLNNNKLGNDALATLLEAGRLLSHVAWNQNHVTVVPAAITKHKKIKQLCLDDNPIAWPHAPEKPHDWKRAVQQDAVGRRVFRMYTNEDEDDNGRIHFVDLEIVLMGDPIFCDKDEDRGDVRIGTPGWCKGKHNAFTLPMHNRAQKTNFGDPDIRFRPYYRNELPGELPHHVLPMEYLSVSVMDGHGGPWVSEALRQGLFNKLHESGLMEPKLPENVEEAMVQLYKDVDETILGKLSELGRRDGSTCVNAIFNSDQTLISHVGDSRCVLGLADGTLEQVTADHDPDVEAEKKAVEARGGRVQFHPIKSRGGCWRVNGDLAMTRSFGDPNVKDVISCVPDVAVRPPLKDLDCFVMASDGLWHHVESSMAISMIRNSRNSQIACNKLYDLLLAQIRGGKNDTFGADNVMICVGKISRGSQAKDCPKIEL